MLSTCHSYHASSKHRFISFYLTWRHPQLAAAPHKHQRLESWAESEWLTTTNRVTRVFHARKYIPNKHNLVGPRPVSYRRGGIISASYYCNGPAAGRCSGNLGIRVTRGSPPAASRVFDPWVFAKHVTSVYTPAGTALHRKNSLRNQLLLGVGL